MINPKDLFRNLLEWAKQRQSASVNTVEMSVRDILMTDGTGRQPIEVRVDTSDLAPQHRTYVLRLDHRLTMGVVKFLLLEVKATGLKLDFSYTHGELHIRASLQQAEEWLVPHRILMSQLAAVLRTPTTPRWNHYCTHNRHAAA